MKRSRSDFAIHTRLCTATRVVMLGIALALSLGVAPIAMAEQFELVGDHQVHYIVIPTTFLSADIAAQYDLPRGRDRALVNVSVLDAEGKPVTARVSGASANLLGQRQDLDFKEVREEYAVYYLALLRHANEEHQRIELQITLQDGTDGTISFRQKMYWDE